MLGYGALCVMILGTRQMPALYVLNLDMAQVCGKYCTHVHSQLNRVKWKRGETKAHTF